MYAPNPEAWTKGMFNEQQNKKVTNKRWLQIKKGPK